MPAEWRIVPLDRKHGRSAFDCGEPALNVVVLVDAKDDKAKRFYARYEFESLPDQPLLLWLPMRAVSRLFADTIE